MKQWKTTSDIRNAIQDAHARLVDGTSDIGQANSEARLFAQVTKVIQLQLEHAKLTGKLGSSGLPDVKLG